MTRKPIFVLGRHRSGTTWLASALASIPQVYAPMDAGERRVHESAFFSHLVRHCNHGRTREDLLEVKWLFERSRYFALTGLHEGPDILATGAAGYFRRIMEAGAEMNGAQYWLEKTPAHTLHSRYLAEAFPDAVFVAVLRDYRAVVASNVHAFGSPGSVRDWFRHSVVTAVYEKIVARRNVIVVRYESLVRDYDASIRELLHALGLGDERVLPISFRRNSSFSDQPPAFTRLQRIAMSTGRWLIRPLPAACVERAIIAWRRRTPEALPPWFFARGHEAGEDP